MAIVIKNAEDIAKMRIAGRLAADVLDMVAPRIVPGVTTGQIDQWVHAYIVDVQKAIPAPLGYHGYPKSVCTSVNDVVCHGIPDDRTVLHAGDIVNVDVTVIKDGYHGDTSMMVVVGGTTTHDAQRLVDTTYAAMVAGIQCVCDGAHFGDIGHAIQSYVEPQGYNVVRDYCGHGIGRGFHEEPNVVHYGRTGSGPLIKTGMIFTIEPMINAGVAETVLSDDGWTAVTVDGHLSAQWEHTVLVTADGYEVLTLRAGEVI